MLRLYRNLEPARQRGMTLPELLVVVTIMGIIAAVAVPRFSNSLLKQQAVTVARQIAMDIETVRRVSRVASTSKSISFNSVDKTYTLNGVTNPDRSNDAYVVSIVNYAPTAKFGAINLGGDAVLIFNGFGLPDSGGIIPITVGGATKKVVVDAATGSATVQ